MSSQQQKSPKKALAMLGATASGKSKLSLHLAQQFPCEIISLDSALVYQDMNIGTAKPTPDELAIVPHHLIDIITPLQSYSAAEFVADCVKLVDEIHARGRFPLIVGGTMMYFHALMNGLNDLPQADENTRKFIQEQKNTHGLAHLYAQLQQHDPETAARLPPNDTQRIERALEVFFLTGKPLSQHFAEQQNKPVLDWQTLVLLPENRAQLHAQIERRFHAMIEMGFVDEVIELKQKYPDLNENANSVRCVGYRQAWDYLNGLISHDDFVEQGIIATRQLAKRQLTWLRKTPADVVIDPFALPFDEQLERSLAVLKQFFNH